MSRNYLRSRVLLLVVLVGGCRGGCAPTAPPAPDLLAELPADTRFVASVDLAKVRASALWKQLASYAAQDPADRRRLDELKARTGLDPLEGVDRIVAAFPDNARDRGQFALIIDGHGFDEKRLVAYAQAESPQSEISAVAHGSRTLYRGQGGKVVGFFTGPNRFVLGMGGWGEALADLLPPRQSKGPTAADNDELHRLADRVDRRRALWFAAVVPLDVRQMLLNDPRHDNAASVTRLSAAADLGPGLAAELVADLSNADDARALVQRFDTTVREAKRDGKVLMLGMAPYLDGLSAKADGPTLRLKLDLGEAQMKDLIERLGGFLGMMRGKPAPEPQH